MILGFSISFSKHELTSVHPGPFLSSLELTAEGQREGDGSWTLLRVQRGVDPLSPGAATGEPLYSRGQ